VNDTDRPVIRGVIVDARGLNCPLPVIRLAAAAKGAPAHAILTVLSTDPAARYDVAAWARLRGHEVLAIGQDGEEMTITVRIGELPPVTGIS